MADCEVEGAIARPRGIPPERAMSPTGERSSDRRNIRTGQNPRWDRKGSRRISTEPLYFFKNNESQLGNDV
ncbi:hypothetical protein TNCV_3066611 [Trichonephila clavipes]|nr:hypothetical protein TNCV_3066611 [Trichonephila clavipes]